MKLKYNILTAIIFLMLSHSIIAIAEEEPIVIQQNDDIDITIQQNDVAIQQNIKDITFPMSGPISIGFGENKTGSINPLTEMDTYTFAADPSDVILIRAKFAWYDYPLIRLYAPNGSLIGSASSYNYYQELNKKLSDSGVYTILIGDSDSDNTGDYSVYLQRTNRPGKNVSITSFGKARADSINTSVEMDTFSFNAKLGDSILIRTKSAWYDYPQIRLYAPNGSLIGSASSYNYYQELNKKLDINGQYHILIGDSNGDNIGIYNMYIQILNRPGNKIPIISGDTRQDSINLSSEMKTYIFSAYPKDNVLIRMGAEWYDYPQIRLYAPNGSSIRFVSSYSYNIELARELNNSGEYKILVGDSDSDNTGNYSLYFQLFRAYPASVTNLKNITYAQTYINWTWTDPEDIDFAKVMIYLNGKWKTNVTKGIRYYNATNLIPNTSYVIDTQTVDIDGNINPEHKNHTATTAKDNIPPRSITNLKNITYAQTYINWTWTDPTDSDLKYVIVYVNGIYIKNVAKGVKYANITNLLSDYSYKIMTRTVDTSGNINQTWKTHTARTAI